MNKSDRNTIRKAALASAIAAVLGTVSTQMLAQEDAGANAAANIAGTIFLSQQGAGNTADLSTNDTGLTIGVIAGKTFTQDSTGAKTAADFNATIDGLDNTLYMAQLGDSIFTLNVQGDRNIITLNEFGGGATVVEALLNVVGNDNDITLTATAANALADLLDLDITSDFSVLSLNYDDFSAISGSIAGFASKVTVTQDNLGGAGIASSENRNEVVFAVENTVAEALEGLFTIAQAGLSNKATINSVAAGVMVDVTQSNESPGSNEVTVTANGNESVINVIANGTSTFEITDQGAENTLTVNIGSTPDQTLNVSATIEILSADSTDNTVALTNFKTSNITLTGSENNVVIQGNSNAVVTGDSNDIDVLSDLNIEFSGALDIDVIGNDNVLNTTHSEVTVGSYLTGLNTKYHIYGDLNSFLGSFTDVSDVLFTIDGNSNDVDYDVQGFSLVELDIDGSSNTYNAAATGSGILSSSITGSYNQITLAMSSSETGGGSANYTTSYTGDSNEFGYTLGDATLSHIINGNGFEGSVNYNSTSGGYDQSLTKLGDSGDMTLTSPSGSVYISTTVTAPSS